MDGIQAARTIKHELALTAVPAIIMVSAYGHEELVRQAGDLEFEAFLLKPVRESTLVAAIAQALGIETAGAEVVTAGNGREALERIGAGSFDVVLMDIEMPEMASSAARPGSTGASMRRPASPCAGTTPAVTGRCSCSGIPRHGFRGRTGWAWPVPCSSVCCWCSRPCC